LEPTPSVQTISKLRFPPFLADLIFTEIIENQLPPIRSATLVASFPALGHLFTPTGKKGRQNLDRLRGKRALITGGTTGIGLETARAFLKEGARVAVTGRNPESLESARRELGSDVLVIASDASKVADQQQVADAINKAFGGLDALFVNAGIAELRPVEKWDEAAFDRTFNLNLKGPYFLIQALLPLFADPSSIVVNGSVNAHIGMPNTTVYGASKAALVSLVRTLSGELISRGIRVNAVSPGPINTPLYSKLGLSEKDLKSVAESIKAQVPAGRFGNPGEIAQVVVFLASNGSAFTVGSELLIDGGMGTL